MNHDIAHCAGGGCKLRNTCQRYLAHLDLDSQTQTFRDNHNNYVGHELCNMNDLYIPVGEENKKPTESLTQKIIKKCSKRK